MKPKITIPDVNEYAKILYGFLNQYSDVSQLEWLMAETPEILVNEKMRLILDKQVSDGIPHTLILGVEDSDYSKRYPMHIAFHLLAKKSSLFFFCETSIEGYYIRGKDFVWNISQCKDLKSTDLSEVRKELELLVAYTGSS